MLKKYTPELLLLSIAVVWGASYSLTKEALAFVSVYLFLTLRFGLTSIFLMPFTLKKISKISFQSLLFGSLLGLILSGIFFAETFGVKYTTATNATILISLSIIFTPFVDILRTKKAPPKALIFAAFLSVLGVYILTNNKGLNFNLGDIFILIAATLRAVMLSATKVFTNRYKFDSLALTQIQMVVIFIVSFIFLLFSKESITLNIDIKFWLILLFIVLFCTILAFFAQNYGVKHSTPSKASMLMGTEPLFGVLFAIILLGEKLTINVIIGGTLIFIATFIGLRVKE